MDGWMEGGREGNGGFRMELLLMDLVSMGGRDYCCCCCYWEGPGGERLQIE